MLIESTEQSGRRRSAGGDAGYTLFEVTIASAILLVVMASFFGLMISLSNTERRIDAAVISEEAARLVMGEMARDIRAANPMDAFTTSNAEYNNKVQVRLGAAGAQTVVRWVYDTNPSSPTFRSLSRQSVNPISGVVLTSTVKLTNLRNVDRGLPMLSYYAGNGVDLVSTSTAANIGNCAVRVHIEFAADGQAQNAVPLISNAQLRNRLSGGLGCS